MQGMDLSDDELEAYESQLEDLEAKALLADIAATNHAILRELRLMNGQQEQDTPDLYECDMCGAEVTQGEREEHLRNDHNYPVGPGDDMIDFYEPC